MAEVYIVRKCRETKANVILASPGVEAIPSEGWMTICELHGGCVGHETRKLAEGWLSHPKDWCSGCQEERHGK